MAATATLITPALTTSTSLEAHPVSGQSRSFYFVRHGATEPNLSGVRCGGDLNMPLTEVGRQQARTTGERVLALKIDVGVIVCSGLKRTRQHAEIVNEILGGGVPIVVDPLLNERNMGEWNLRSVAATEPLLAQGMDPPGGESEQEFVDRVTEMFERFPILLPLNPLIISSKAVARVLNLLLGGKGRLTLDNGEMIQFTMHPMVSLKSSERHPK